MLDDVLPIDFSTGLLLPSILFFQLEVLLHVNLQVEHFLALLLLNLELLEHHLGIISLILKCMGQLHCHLSLRLEMLSFLIGFGDASTLDLVLELEVLLIDAALLCQRLLNLRLGHLLLILEIFDPGFSDRDVDLDKVSLLTGLHCLSNSFLGQVAIVELTSLHILRPAVSKNLVVKNINVFVKPVTIFFHLINDFLLLGGCQFTLTNVSVADQVVIV